MTDTAVRTETQRPAARLDRGRLALLVGGLGGLLLLAVVAWLPGGLTLDVGQPGDALFLRGFHGDERADGRSYRWTRGVAQVVAPGLGGADRLRLSLVAEAGRTPPQSVPVEVLIDGRPVGRIEVASAAEHSSGGGARPRGRRRGHRRVSDADLPAGRRCPRSRGHRRSPHARADRLGLVAARLGKPVDAVGRAGRADGRGALAVAPLGARRRLVGVVGARRWRWARRSPGRGCWRAGVG